MIKRIVILLFVLPVLAFASGGMQPVGFNQIVASAGAQLFYSDFNDATNDAKWVSLPAGWNDDYATSPAPLEGAESLLTDTTSYDWHSATFTTQTSGTTYARYSFRVKDLPTVDNSLNVFLSLNLDDATQEAVCTINYDTTTSKFIHVRAYDDSASYEAGVFTTPTALNDATYFLVLTYNRGTSVTCTVTDSGGSALAGGSAVITTANTSNVNRVYVGNGDGGGTLIVDQVEVRSDTNWGTP